jgi:hypothetical protein
MNVPGPNLASRDRIAPVVELAERRPERHSPLRDGLRGLALAFVIGAGIAVSVAAFGLAASMAVHHAAVALPVLVILATLATWPITMRRMNSDSDRWASSPAAAARRLARESSAAHPTPAPKGRSAPARVLQHPTAKFNRG